MRQALAGLLFLNVSTLVGQEFRATISGRVTDAQGAVIPSVKIAATQVGTEARFETVSAGDGLYAIPFLPPASYRLTAESAACPGTPHAAQSDTCPSRFMTWWW
jgi:hypothetical protein